MYASSALGGVAARPRWFLWVPANSADTAADHRTLILVPPESWHKPCNQERGRQRERARCSGAHHNHRWCLRRRRGSWSSTRNKRQWPRSRWDQGPRQARNPSRLVAAGISQNVESRNTLPKRGQPFSIPSFFPRVPGKIRSRFRHALIGFMGAQNAFSCITCSDR